MRTYSGSFLTRDGFIQAEITVEGGTQQGEVWGEKKKGQIVDFEEGGDSGEEAIIIPTPYDAHIHSGDSVVKTAPEGTLPDVVGPGGFKHKMLSEATDDEIVNAMNSYFKELIRNGVRDFIEFREGGIEGLQLMKEALEDLEEHIRFRVMSRPSKKRFDEWELNKILSLSDGIGISSYRDWNETQLLRIASATKEMKKPFAMHCSEYEREPIDKILDMGVHHLVHMVEADMDDLIACAIENVPIVICPRSNMYFGKIPDIPTMLESDLTLALGTDNSMLAAPDMFREMEFAFRAARMRGGVDPLEILKMATLNPRKALNHPSDIQAHQDVDNYVIMEPCEGDPSYELVTRSSAKEIIDIVEW